MSVSIEEENAVLRDTVKRLNRRCQLAEAALAGRRPGIYTVNRAALCFENVKLREEVAALRSITLTPPSDDQKCRWAQGKTHVIQNNNR